MKPVIKWILGLGVVGGVVAASVPFWPAKSTYDDKAAEQRLAVSGEDKAKLIKRGKYLAAVADCAACHQSPDGAPYAGGHPIETPFGVIYGTNITPDKETGIGNYTSADFYHAVVDGVRADGKRVYPAMPYVSYHTIRPEDSDAIYAYLMGKDVAVWNQTANILPVTEQEDHPKGIAEVVQIPTIPAVANAVAHAVGKYLRELPLTEEKIKEALS